MIFTDPIRKNSRFKYIYDHGKSLANKYLVVFVIKNNLLKNHLGICVSKKIGKSHVRNRVTRLIKENYRLNEKLFCLGFDIIFMARKNIIDLDFYQIKNSMLSLARKHKIIL